WPLPGSVMFHAKSFSVDFVGKVDWLIPVPLGPRNRVHSWADANCANVKIAVTKRSKKRGKAMAKSYSERDAIRSMIPVLLQPRARSIFTKFPATSRRALLPKILPGQRLSGRQRQSVTVAR